MIAAASADRAAEVTPRIRAQAGSMPRRPFASADSGSVEKGDQRAGFVGAGGPGADSDREGRDRLNRRRDEADNIDPRFAEEFAELLHADFGLALRHQRRDRHARLGLDEAGRLAGVIEPPVLSRLREDGFRSGRSNSRSSARRRRPPGPSSPGHDVRPRRAGPNGRAPSPNGQSRPCFRRRRSPRPRAAP